MDREEIVRIAREKLGVSARFATGEYTMLARLLQGGETIAAMLLARSPGGWVRASGLVIVATERRLLLLSKGMVTRRERVEEIPREHLRGARLDAPATLVLELEDGERRFTLATPAAQLAELLAYADGDRGPSRFGELTEIARRKVGKVLGFGLENELLVLDGALGEVEAVLDLAYSLKDRGTLLAVCPKRVLVVPNQPLRGPIVPVEAIDYADVAAVDGASDQLTLDTPAGTRRFETLVPDRAGEVIAGRIAARATV